MVQPEQLAELDTPDAEHALAGLVPAYDRPAEEDAAGVDEAWEFDGALGVRGDARRRGEEEDESEEEEFDLDEDEDEEAEEEEEEFYEEEFEEDEDEDEDMDDLVEDDEDE